MSQYSCPFAEEIGHRYRLSPEQVWPDSLRSLATGWHPHGYDLSEALTAAASKLEAELRDLGYSRQLPRGR